jgi:hypothetical protein
MLSIIAFQHHFTLPTQLLCFTCTRQFTLACTHYLSWVRQHTKILWCVNSLSRTLFILRLTAYKNQPDILTDNQLFSPSGIVSRPTVAAITNWISVFTATSYAAPDSVCKNWSSDWPVSMSSLCCLTGERTSHVSVRLLSDDGKHCEQRKAEFKELQTYGRRTIGGMVEVQLWHMTLVLRYLPKG